MELSNGKFSIEHNKDFSLKTLMFNLNSAFAQSEKINREALNDLEFQYSTLLSKLEDKFNSSKNLLNELTRKGESSKEALFERIEKLMKKVKNYENSFGDFSCLKDELKNEVFGEFKDIQQLVAFSEGRLKEMNPEIFSGEFSLSYVNEDFRLRARWFFVDPEEMVEREFINSVGRQLEEGFLGFNCDNKAFVDNGQVIYNLKLKYGKVFGQAYFDSMEMKTQNPKKTFYLVRKQL